jgi:hypothetical protein
VHAATPVGLVRAGSRRLQHGHELLGDALGGLRVLAGQEPPLWDGLSEKGRISVCVAPRSSSVSASGTRMIVRSIGDVRISIKQRRALVRFSEVGVMVTQRAKVPAPPLLPDRRCRWVVLVHQEWFACAV